MLSCVFIFNSFSGEMTGAGRQIKNILSRNNMSESILRAQGLRLGEVTGAGKRVNISDITYFITKDELIPMNRVSHLSYHNDRSGRSVSDISGLEYRGQMISSRHFLGIIYR